MKSFLVIFLVAIVITLISLIKDALKGLRRKTCRVGRHHTQGARLTRWYCYDHRLEFYAAPDDPRPICPEQLKEEIEIGGNNDLTRKNNSQR